MLWLLLLISTAFSLNIGLDLINTQRSHYKLPKVMYNDTVEKIITQFNSKINGSVIDYYYTNSKIYNYSYVLYPNKSRKWSGDFIMQELGLDREGWKFGWRDRTFRTPRYITGFRIQQRDCFNFSKCSNTFSDYITCLIKGAWVSDGHCAYAFQYYPVFVQKKFYEVACVKLYNIGNNTIYANSNYNKPLAFFCYIRLHSATFSDNPLIG
jgi:hypothetical protein